MSLTNILFGVFITLLLSNSIFGLSKTRSADTSFRPLLFFPLVFLLFEVARSFIDLGEAKLLVDHSQPLIEFYLLIWLRKKWGFTTNKTLIPFWSTIAGIFVLWVASIPQHDQPTIYMLYFRIAVCIQAAMIATKMMVQASTDVSKQLSQNSAFLFGAGLIFYYTLSGLTDMFGVFAKDAGYSFGESRLYFNYGLGILANLVYLRAYIYIPGRGNYSLESW